MKETQLKTPSGRSELFVDGTGGHEDQLIILLYGEEHSGKSRLGATGPEIAGYVPTDRKTRYSAEKASKEFGTKILLPKNDLVREAIKGIRSGWMTEAMSDHDVEKLKEATKAQYRTHANAAKEIAWTLYDHPDVKLIQIDSFGQLYQDVIFAHYGRTGHVIKRIGKEYFKDKTEANKEMKDFVDSLSGKHLILTHQNKAEYENNKATGVDTWAGWGGLGFSCNLQIQMRTNSKFNPASEKVDEQWHWGLDLIKSIHKPELEGEAGQLLLTDDMITLTNLMTIVLGD